LQQCQGPGDVGVEQVPPPIARRACRQTQQRSRQRHDGAAGSGGGPGKRGGTAVHQVQIRWPRGLVGDLAEPLVPSQVYCARRPRRQTQQRSRQRHDGAAGSGDGPGKRVGTVVHEVKIPWPRVIVVDMTESLFPSQVYSARLTRAAELAADRGIGGLVFGTGPDLEYLIGSKVSSHERLTALVVPAAGGAVEAAGEGANGGAATRPVLVLPAVERGDLPASAVPDLDVDVVLWADGENPHRLVADALGMSASNGGPVLGVGASLTADHLLPILEFTGARAVLAGDTLRELFMRKDAAEIDQLRDAGAAIDRVHARVPGMLRAGRTEADVAAELHDAILEEGHTAVDFIIVGSGPNGANPHHDFSDRTLDDGDVVVVDIGGTWGVGYHSDCTRTYVIGQAPERATAAWDVLRAAQEAAVAAVRPGVTAASI